MSKRSKAWPLHNPGRRELSASAQPQAPPPGGWEAGLDFTLIPLKRKYRTYRAYMQSPVSSPSQTPRKGKRPYFPLCRQRAIRSSIAP